MTLDDIIFHNKLFRDIEKFYIDNMEVASGNWSDSEEELKAKCRQLLEEHEGDLFAKDMITAVYRELHRLTDYNEKLRNEAV